MLRPSRLSRSVPPPDPAIGGRSSTRGQRFSPSGPLPLAPAVVNQRPRPATSRYPVSENDFLAEQAQAEQPNIPAAMPADKPPTEIGIAFDASASAAPAAPVVAPAAPAAVPTVPTTFTGIPATNWAPPDCALAAGPDHVLLAVNSSVALYDKAGAQQWVLTLDQWFINEVQGHKIFDPRAIYDQHEDRWVLVAAALGPDDSEISLFLLSVSETNDPNGSWNNYALDATLDGDLQTNNWGDYPTLGVDNQALYITANMFAFNGGFQYAKIRIIEKRPGPYDGSPVSFVDIPNLKDPQGRPAFTVQPCHTFGAPPAQYFVSAVFPGSTELVLWKLVDPLAATRAITSHTVPVSAYGVPPKGEQPPLPPPAVTPPIETGDTRMQNAVFRNDSIWAALTTRHNWGEPQNRAALHWFEIDPEDPAGPALKQQGVFGAAGVHYYYPAVAPDANGNVAVVFSRSSATEFPGANVTGRAPADAAGNLRPSAPIQAGLATYIGTRRWGWDPLESTCRHASLSIL